MKALILMSALTAGLWFSACKTTPEPNTPSTQLPPTQQTAKTPPTPSSETRNPDQTGAQPGSKTPQKTDPDAAEAVKQSPTEKVQTHSTASKDAGESTPTEAGQKSEERQSKAPSTQAAQKSGDRQSKTPPTAKSKLEKAREDLRVSEATEQKIAAKLEELKKSGNGSAEDIRNYEIYHERVRDMVAENRKRVEKMENAYRKHTPDEITSQTPAGMYGSGETIPEEQTQDQVAELDRQLTASLNQFDAMILKEMETIENQSAATMRDLAQEAAEAAKRLKEKGIDLGTAESESSDEASKKEKAPEREASALKKDSEAEEGDVDDAVASSDQSKGQGPGPGRDPGSRYSKEDDDIVARQLREAAENETDPELKEKLWKEYEDYKKNTR